MPCQSWETKIRNQRKNPKETKLLLTELDRGIREAEDLGEVISGPHAKATLIGLLDPAIKLQTALVQGKCDYPTLRAEVMKFVSYAPRIRCNANRPDRGRRRMVDRGR